MPPRHVRELPPVEVCDGECGPWDSLAGLIEFVAYFNECRLPEIAVTGRVERWAILIWQSHDASNRFGRFKPYAARVVRLNELN